MAGSLVFSMGKSGRSTVSPSTNPWSASQTLPLESLMGDETPVLMRIVGRGASGAFAASGAFGVSGTFAASGTFGASGAFAAAGPVADAEPVVLPSSLLV